MHFLVSTLNRVNVPCTPILKLRTVATFKTFKNTQTHTAFQGIVYAILAKSADTERITGMLHLSVHQFTHFMPETTRRCP